MKPDETATDWLHHNTAYRVADNPAEVPSKYGHFHYKPRLGISKIIETHPAHLLMLKVTHSREQLAVKKRPDFKVKGRGNSKSNPTLPNVINSQLSMNGFFCGN